jgi:hypothetical protein
MYQSSKDCGFINFPPPPNSEDYRGQPSAFFVPFLTSSTIHREIERIEIGKVKSKLQPVVN